MNKKFTDEMLETMLRNYFLGQPKAAFSVDLNKKRRSDFSMSKSMLLKTAAVCTCAAAVLTVGVFSSVKLNTDKASDSILSSALGNQFSITAYADEQQSKSSVKMVTMNDNETFLIPDDSKYKEKVDYLNEGETVYFLDDEIPTMLSGDDLEEYLASGESTWNGYNVISIEKIPSVNSNDDLEGDSEYGGVYYNSEKMYYFLDNEDKTPLLGDELKEYLASGESAWNGYDVIKLQDPDFLYNCINLDVTGENIVSYDVECESGDLFNNFNYDYGNKLSVPFDDDHFVQWSAKLYNEDTDVDGTAYDYYSVLKRSENAEQNLQTAENYTEYFGDTIKVTAHFDDGETQVSTIVITLDENGNYIVNYK